MSQKKDDENLQFVINKIKEESSQTKTSDSFSSTFDEKLSEQLNQKTKVLRYRFAFASIIIFAAIISLFLYLQSPSTKQKSSYAVSEERIRIEEKESNLQSNTLQDSSILNNLASNFESNSVLENYYGQMRSSFECEIETPVLGKVYEFTNTPVKVAFRGNTKKNLNTDTKMLLKIYIGSKQKEIIEKELYANSIGEFIFETSFNIPGQYSWKIIANDEIAAAGNFFIGKPPAK